MQTTRKLTVAELRRTLTTGTVWEVTNHYIKPQDHPCFGTTVRTITRATTAGFSLSVPGEDRDSYTTWPKSRQLSTGPDGSIHIAGPYDSDQPFLTIRKPATA